jgi:hypothetical protein
MAILTVMFPNWFGDWRSTRLTQLRFSAKANRQMLTRAIAVAARLPVFSEHPTGEAFRSFGGWKRSLFGDMAVHGPEGVRFYTRIKTMTARWPTGIRAGAEYVMPTMR